MRSLALLWLIPTLSGCAIFGSSKTPLRKVEFPINSESATLLLMIHGTGDSPESFEAHQFVEELVARGADVDAVAVQTKLAYYRDSELDDRIHQDVVLPARERGIERIIVLGVSIGGLGALSYAHAHPEQVDGLILFAPFLGPGLYVKEIEAQGGLLRWWPNAPFEDVEFAWLFLADYGRGRTEPPIELMYGRQDHFARSLDILAGVLPRDDVHTIDGRHEWKSWLTLWRDHLDRDPFHLVPHFAAKAARRSRRS